MISQDSCDIKIKVKSNIESKVFMDWCKRILKIIHLDLIYARHRYYLLFISFVLWGGNTKF